MQMSKPLMKREGKTSDDLQLNQAQAEGDGKEKRKTGQERETRTKRKLWKREEKWHKNPQTHGGMKRQKCRRNAQSIMEHPPQ